jgi:hypothetical protein
MKIKYSLICLLLPFSNYSLGKNNLGYSEISEIKSGSYDEIYIQEPHQCTGNTTTRYDLPSNNDKKLSILMMAFSAKMKVRLEYACSTSTGHPIISKVRVKN